MIQLRYLQPTSGVEEREFVRDADFPPRLFDDTRPPPYLGPVINNINQAALPPSPRQVKSW